MAPAAAASASHSNLHDNEASSKTKTKTKTKTTLCVMDASGLLGSTLVHRLLHRGYTVHAALQRQSHSHGEQVECFKGFTNKKLKVFHSDPLDYHSIMDALKGCSALFYSFEPPPSDSGHPTTYDELMAETEVRAAHNVLEACAQTDTIQKVVFTSSVTAVIWRDHRNTATSPDPPDLDEKSWSDVHFCKKFKLWHALSKTLAEKTAWALAMDRGLNMVSINGGLLMAPDLTITNPYLKGAAEMYEQGLFVTVDLEFIVDAHISVFEDMSSYGRYVCFSHAINCYKGAIELASMLLPPSQFSPQSSQSVEKGTRVYHQQKISNKKLNKLMVDLDSGLQAQD